MSSKKLLFVSLAVFGLLAVVNYFPVFQGKVPFPSGMILGLPDWQGASATEPSRHAELGDLVTMFFPWRAFARDAIRHFKLPLWNPHILAGTPFVANALSAVFYPLNFLYYVLPLKLAWSLRLMLQIVLAGCFMSLFVRAIGGSIAGSLGAGIIYSLCGFITAWAAWTQADAAVWLPLMFFSVDRLWRSPGIASVVLAAGSFAMPVLAGHPETAIYTALASGIFALFRFGWMAKGNWRAAVFRISLFGFAAALAGGLASAQLIPTLAWVPDLPQRIDMIWPAAHPDQIAGLFSRDSRSNPNSAGIDIPESASYVGMLTFLLMTLAPLHRNRRDAFFFIVLAAVALLVIFGWGPLGWAASRTPVVKALKPWRLWIVVDFSLAVLAGLGLSALQCLNLKEHRQYRRYAAILAGSGLAVGVAGVYALLLQVRFSPGWLRSPQASAVLLAAGAILIACRCAGRVSARGFAYSAVGLLALDLLTFSYGHIPFVRSKTVFSPSPVMEFLRAHTSGQYRVAALDSHYFSNFEMMYGLSSPAGYENALARTVALLRDFGEATGISLRSEAVARIRDRRLDLVSLKYLVASSDSKGLDALMEQSGRFSLVYSHGGTRVLENRSVLARAFLVPASGIQEVKAETDQLDELRNPQFDPARSVLLFGRPGRFEGVEHLQDRSIVSGIRDGVNTSTIIAEANRPSILVFAETWYPGWKVHVDGQPARLLRADYTLMGVALTAGPHVIEFSFEPASVQLGIGISLVSVGVILVLSFGLLRGLSPAARNRIRWLVPIPALFGIVGLVMAVTTSKNEVNRPPASAPSANYTSSLRFDKTPFSFDLGRGAEIESGYARIDPVSESVSVAGFARVGYGSYESVSPATSAASAWMIPVQFDSGFRTAISITNPTAEPAVISFSLPRLHQNRTFTIPSNSQLSAFIDENPFNAKRFHGADTAFLKSNVRVAVAAMLTSNPKDSEFRMVAMPAVNPGSIEPGTRYAPYEIDCATCAAHLLLMNPADTVITGRHRWFDQAGSLQLERPYTIAPNQTLDYVSNSSAGKGWIEVAPDTPAAAPSALVLLLAGEGDSQVPLAGIPAQNALRESTVYVEVSHDLSAFVLLMNPGSHAAMVRMYVNSEEQKVMLPPFASESREIGLSRSGLVRVQSDLPVVAVSMQRQAGNEPALISVLPPVAFLKGPVFFPRFAVGGPYSSAFSVFTAGANISGMVRFFNPAGMPLSVRIRPIE